MKKAIGFLFKNRIRLIAVFMCLVLISVYFTSNTFAIYKSSASSSSAAKVASLGTISLSGVDTFDITPGVDVTRSLKISKAKASQNDVPTWLVFSVDKSSYNFSDSDNTFYISGNSFSNWHDINTNDRAIYFQIDSSVWSQKCQIGNKIFFGCKLNANQEVTYSVLKNDIVYVSAEINSDDVEYINSVVNSTTFNYYLASSYGYENTSDFSALCTELNK